LLDSVDCTLCPVSCRLRIDLLPYVVALLRVVVIVVAFVDFIYVTVDCLVTGYTLLLPFTFTLLRSRLRLLPLRFRCCWFTPLLWLYPLGYTLLLVPIPLIYTRCVPLHCSCCCYPPLTLYLLLEVTVRKVWVICLVAFVPVPWKTLPILVGALVPIGRAHWTWTVPPQPHHPTHTHTTLQELFVCCGVFVVCWCVNIVLFIILLPLYITLLPHYTHLLCYLIYCWYYCWIIVPTPTPFIVTCCCDVYSIYL